MSHMPFKKQNSNPLYTVEELATIIGLKEIAVYDLQKKLRDVTKELDELKNAKTPGVKPEKE